MSGHPHTSRHARLVSAFAASAFALLVTLSLQQRQVNTVTANLLQNLTVEEYSIAR